MENYFVQRGKRWNPKKKKKTVFEPKEETKIHKNNQENKADASKSNERKRIENRKFKTLQNIK